MTDRYAVFGNPDRPQQVAAHPCLVRGADPAGHQLRGDPRRQGWLRGGDRGLPRPPPRRRTRRQRHRALQGRGLSPRHRPHRRAPKPPARVNTLSFDGAEILGDNTDGAGLVRDLKHNLGCDPAGRRILLLGAGGAARGVILPLLLENPTELLIANRTEETAARLALEFARLPGCAVGVKPDGCGFAGLAGRNFDLVINATSAGLSGAALPLPTSVFRSTLRGLRNGLWPRDRLHDASARRRRARRRRPGHAGRAGRRGLLRLARCAAAHSPRAGQCWLSRELKGNWGRSIRRCVAATQ
jgi:hypothetical protein